MNGNSNGFVNGNDEPTLDEKALQMNGTNGVVENGDCDSAVMNGTTKRNSIKLNGGVANGGGDNHEPAFVNVPENCGIRITVDPQQGSYEITFEPDDNYTEIHPRAHGPASMQDLRLLHGGGSGVAVFHGHHPELGSLVMKHGRPSDTVEVFSLAVLSRELLVRGASSPEALEAAHDMRRRIPEFRMIYISPYHLRDRAYELWYLLRKHFSEQSLSSWPSSASSSSSSDDDECTMSESLVSHRKRRIQLRQSANGEIKLRNVYVDLLLPFDQVNQNGVAYNDKKGFDIIHDFILKELTSRQQKHNWKVTLAQKTIGAGAASENTAVTHTSGRLRGHLLTTLLDEFIRVIHNCQHLTRADEKDVVDLVREEVAKLEAKPDVSNVSSLCNAFVGGAIRKNFGKSGRFQKLRHYGKLFRSGRDLILSEAEQYPANLLGRMLKPGADLDTIFDNPGFTRCALDLVQDSWLDVLKLSISVCPSGLERIWTCGLTDAGLHNSFLSEDFLWLFDLGEPELLSAPAFLTKFLMSFYHTFGMTDSDDNVGAWFVRFESVFGDKDKVCLTPETKAMLPLVYESFAVTLHRFVEELFENDEGVSKLLIHYVVLQLLSDAGFCLDNWKKKGGGNQDQGDVDRKLEKWLWRSLWDLFIASAVHGQLM